MANYCLNGTIKYVLYINKKDLSTVWFIDHPWCGMFSLNQLNQFSPYNKACFLKMKT